MASYINLFDNPGSFSSDVRRSSRVCVVDASGTICIHSCPALPVIGMMGTCQWLRRRCVQWGAQKCMFERSKSWGFVVDWECGREELTGSRRDEGLGLDYNQVKVVIQDLQNRVNTEEIVWFDWWEWEDWEEGVWERSRNRRDLLRYPRRQRWGQTPSNSIEIRSRV